jgi:hypothetical protein
MKPRTPVYGLMAEFDSPQALVHAAEAAYNAGYRKMDGYSPFPIEELAHAIGFRKNRLPLIVLMGGIAGCLGGFLMQYWYAVYHYPINVGGKPLNSWPNWIPVTFECTVLLAAFAAVFGMIALNGLPMPYHPVFNAPRFALASKDRFFLCIETTDPQFDRDATKDFLVSLRPREITEVPH